MGGITTTMLNNNKIVFEDVNGDFSYVLEINVLKVEGIKKINFKLKRGLTPFENKVGNKKVVTAFAHVDKNAHLELLMPLNNEGPIQKFIEKMCREKLLFDF